MRVSLKLALALVLVCSFAVYTRADEETAATTTNEDSQPTTTEEAAAPAATDGVNADGFSATELETLQKQQETHEFQAEVNRLMDIIINSLYSNREIFIRELISNASDALDKIRYLSLKNKDALGDQPDLDIRVRFDKKAKTLTIVDTGVGMTKSELVKNLGVVASSGTTKFVEAATGGADTLSLIGQFGVGFYSVYLVADKVTVVSKSNDDVQHVWESTAKRTFTVAPDPRGNTLKRGTEIILHLKDDASEFLDASKLKSIVEKYSQFINFPIYLQETKTITEEVPDEDAKEDAEKTEKEDKDEEELEVTEEEDKEKEKKKKTIEKEVTEWNQVNENKAIWTRKPNDVSKEEYESFYKTVAKDDHRPPLTWSHFNAEGEISFKAILYVPKEAAHDLYDKYYGKSQSLKLYVRRVLISDEFEDFMPRYLSFIRGVVDSEDLPLNVSRETLSKSKVLKVMGKKLVRKALEMLRKLAEENAPKKKKAEKSEDDEDDEDKEEDDEDKEKEEEAETKDEKKEDRYLDFWKQFGKSIKLGCIEDAKNKAKLTKLLRFTSLNNPEKFISFQEYVDNMKEKQDSIYYITGENVDQVKNSPFLEKLKKRSYDVLFMTDPLDEYLMGHVTEFDGKKFQSVTKEGLKFGDESEEDMKKKEKALNKMYEKLTSWLKTLYGDKVEKVTVSNRIENSPCVLVTSQWGWSANMERIMKAQAFGDAERQKYMISKKTLEINPRHPIIMELKNRVETSGDEQSVKDLANLMFDAALLASGFNMENVDTFASRIHRVMSSGLNVAPDAQVVPEEQFEVPELPEEEDKKKDEDTEQAEASDEDSKPNAEADDEDAVPPQEREPGDNEIEDELTESVDATDDSLKEDL